MNRTELFRQMEISILIIMLSVLIALIVIAYIDAPGWVYLLLSYMGAVAIYAQGRLIKTINKHTQ